MESPETEQESTEPNHLKILTAMSLMPLVTLPVSYFQWVISVFWEIVSQKLNGTGEFLITGTEIQDEFVQHSNPTEAPDSDDSELPRDDGNEE